MTPDIILQRTGIDVRAVDQWDDAWHKLRLGVLTAFEAYKLIGQRPANNLWPDL